MSATDTYSSLVQQFYVAYFGRPADAAALPNFSAALAAANAPTGLAELTSAYASNDAIHALIDSFGNSAESASLYGALGSGAANASNFITAIYANLFNRAPDAGGLAFWTTAITSGALTPGAAALNIAAGAASNTSTQGQLDALTLSNKTTVAALFTADLNAPVYVAAYAGDSAAAQARALLHGVNDNTTPGDYTQTVQLAADTLAHLVPLTLTNGIDNLSAPEFDAVVSGVAGATTLNAGDTLHGTKAGNELDIVSDGTAPPAAGITLDHVQTVNIHATADQASVDTRAYAGVTALNITVGATTAGNASLVTAGAATAVNISGDNLSGSAAGLTVSGGASVNISAIGSAYDSADTISGIVVNNTVGAVHITETLSNYGYDASFGDISVNNAGGDVTIRSNIDMSGGAGQPSNINVSNAGGNVFIENTLQVSSATQGQPEMAYITVQGAGASITVNQVVNKPNPADYISEVAQGDVTIIGGRTTTMVAVNQAASLASSPEVFDAIVSISDAAYAQHSTASNSIQSVTLSSFRTATFNGNALASLSLSGASGTLAINNSAAGAATNTTLNLTLDGFSTGAITDTNSEITALNVNNSGTSMLALDDNKLVSVDITGSGVVNQWSLSQNLATLTVHNAGYSGDLSNTRVTTFAPTGAGAIAVTLNAHQSFTGSTGTDTVTIRADATQAISAGSAAHNELILQGSSSNYTAGTAAHASHFTTLGVSDVSYNSDVYDMAIFSGYTALDLVDASSQSDAFVDVAAGTTLTIEHRAAAVTYSLATPSADASVSVDLATAGSLTLTDSGGGGAATLNLNCNTNEFGYRDSIGTLNDVALSSLNISGATGLTIGTVNLGQHGLAVASGVSDFALNYSGSADVAITSLVDDTLSQLNLRGGGVSALGTVEADNAPTLTINNSSATPLAIGTLRSNGNSAAIISNGLSTLTFTGNQGITIGTLADPGNTAAIILANVGTATATISNWLPGSSLNSLTISGDVVLGAAALTATQLGTPISLTSLTGVTIVAPSDNARLNLALAGAGSGHVDTITVGNGNNSLADASTSGHVNITVGSGANTIHLGNAASAGYQVNVTLAAHPSLAGIDDTIFVGTVAAGANAPSVIINGTSNGDQIHFGGDTALLSTQLSTAQQASIAALGSLAAAAGYVDALASTVAHSVTTFQWHGDSYALESVENGNGTLTGADSLIELAGLASTAGVSFNIAQAMNVTLSADHISYTGAALNDTFTGIYGDNSAGCTYSNDDAIDGLGGNNTLIINPANAASMSTFSDSSFGTIVNIENLILNSTSGLSLSTGSHFAADFPTLNLSATTARGMLNLSLASYVSQANVTAATTDGALNIALGTLSLHTASDQLTASSTSGRMQITLGGSDDIISATSLSGTIDIQAYGGHGTVSAQSGTQVSLMSYSADGAVLLAATAPSVSITADRAQSGTYNIVANGSTSSSVNIDDAYGSELFNVTLGAHTAASYVDLSCIGSGPQATAGSYAANTVITGALAGDMLLAANYNSNSNGAIGVLGAQASVNAGVVAAYAAASAGGFEAFTFGGNTYLVGTVAGEASASSSTIVELVGLHTFGVMAGGSVSLTS